MEQEFLAARRMFRELKRKLKCRAPVELQFCMELPSAGLARWNNSPPHQVFINSSYAEDTDEDMLRYLIGHEIGHIIIFTSSRGYKYFPTRESEFIGKEFSFDDYPLRLSFFITTILHEILADFYGVKACGSFDSAFKQIETLEPRDPTENYLRGDLTSDEKTALFYWSMTAQQAALRLFKDSVIYLDVIDETSFSYGCGLMGYDEYWYSVGRILRPLLDYEQKQDEAITRCLASAAYILRQEHSPPDFLFSSLKGIEDELKFHAPAFALGTIKSTAEAYAILDESASQLNGSRHPIKYKAFQQMARATMESFDEQERNTELVFHIGESMGFSTKEILEAAG